MIDGTVARKTDTVSEFGSKLDTAADFIFVAVCLMKLLPVLNVPAWIQVWTGIIAVIKIINIVYGFVVQKRFVAEHMLMNKLTGLMIFVLPLTLFIMELKYSAAVVCVVATFSAIQEGYYIRIGRIKE
ncbi:MAG: CDP-alcohol phosphatidyltransferase family protein [Acutalibacteraceae bacterium]